MTSLAPDRSIAPKARRRATWLLPVVASLITAALGAGYLANAVGLIDATASFSIRGLAGGAAVFTAWRLRDDPARLGSSLMLAVWSFIGGLPGAVIWLVLAVAPIGSRRAELGRADVAASLDQAEVLQHALLDGRLRIEGAHLTRGMRDVFITGSQAEKFQALSAIARRYDAGLAPALRTGLKDRDPAVRVLASSVMASLEATFQGRVRAATLVTRRDAGDVAAWRELSAALLAFAESGLLRADRRREALTRAAECEYLASAGRADKAGPGGTSSGHRQASVLRAGESLPEANIIPAAASDRSPRNLAVTAGTGTVDVGPTAVLAPEPNPARQAPGDGDAEAARRRHIDTTLRQELRSVRR